MTALESLEGLPEAMAATSGPRPALMLAARALAARDRPCGPTLPDGEPSDMVETAPEADLIVPDLARCSYCRDRLATSTLCAASTCSECHEAVLAPIRVRVIEKYGSVGRIASTEIGQGDPGRPRPDHGAGYSDLTCTICSAEWVGVGGSECPWCVRRVGRETRWSDEAARSVERVRRLATDRLICDQCDAVLIVDDIEEHLLGVHGVHDPEVPACNGRLQRTESPRWP